MTKNLLSSLSACSENDYLKEGEENNASQATASCESSDVLKLFL